MSEAAKEAVTRLEHAVTEAAKRLRELHGENEELRARVAALEAEHHRKTEEHSSHSEARETERREITERVERLASGLESLLEGIGEA